jgi:hypothetical protein
VSVHSAITDEEKLITGLRKYITDHKFKAPVAVDNDCKTLDTYGFTKVMPTFVLINRKGNIVEYQPSNRAKPVLEERIKAMIKGDDLEKDANIRTQHGPRSID